MEKLALRTAGRASPGMRYRDVGAAIEFLSRAFGCEVHTTETDPDGTVIYAELSFGSTIIMVGAVSGFDIDRFMKQPGDIGGAETQCCYYVVEDVDAQYARARRAGCEIVIDMQTRPNGARSFTCRDLEGHLWSFGTYDPWQSLSIAPDLADTVPQAMVAADDVQDPTHQNTHPHQDGPKLHNVLKLYKVPRFHARLAAGLSMAVVATSVAAAWVYRDAGSAPDEATTAPIVMGPERVISLELGKETFQQAIKDVRRRLAIERRTRRAAEHASKAAKAEAAKERSLRITAEETAQKLFGQLARAQEATASAQRAASTAKANLEKERASSSESTARDEVEHRRLTHELELALRTAAEARTDLERAKQAQAEAEQEAKRTRARLMFVSHSAKENSEQAIAEIERGLGTQFDENIGRVFLDSDVFQLWEIIRDGFGEVYRNSASAEYGTAAVGMLIK